MFHRKKCRNCGRNVKNDWDYCPYCGAEQKISRPYDSFFKDIEKQFEEIDKIFGSDDFLMPRFEIKPRIRGGGISITITSGTGMKPKVDVKTSGEYKKIEPKIRKSLGVDREVGEYKEERKVPKISEEPKAKIKRKGMKETITIELPDIKKPEDVEIRRLERSIEVKAFADDKAYFKLIPIRPNMTISNKSFEKGVLRIELEG